MQRGDAEVVVRVDEARRQRATVEVDGVRIGVPLSEPGVADGDDLVVADHDDLGIGVRSVHREDGAAREDGDTHAGGLASWLSPVAASGRQGGRRPESPGA